MILIHIKRCPTSFKTEVQIKITLRYHFYSFDQQKYQNWIVYSAGAAMGKQTLLKGAQNGTSVGYNLVMFIRNVSAFTLWSGNSFSGT